MPGQEPVVTPPTHQSGDNPEPDATITPDPLESVPTNEPDGSTVTPPTSEAPKFTQKDLDALAARIRREEADKATRKKQEEQGEYETLYLEQAQKAAALATKVLIRDVCDELELPKDWRDSVIGEDEESIRASVQSLKTRLNKIVEDAIKEQKLTAPGTPPSTQGGSADDDKKGQERTAKLVREAMGFRSE